MTNYSFKNYIKELLILSIPIFLGNIGQMLISLGDVYIAGHYSTNVLASISVASAIFMSFIIPGIGLCSAITPVLSNYRGKKIATRRYFGISVLYSLILSLIFFILLNLCIPFIQNIGLNEKILTDVIIYLKISSFSVFGIFLFSCLREFLQSLEIVLFPNILMLVAVIVNLVLNYVFVFGYSFIPELGTSGLAIASLIVRVLLSLVLFIYCLNFLKHNTFIQTLIYVKDLFLVGAPIAGAMFIEFLGFNIVAVLLGRFEPVYSAAHNIIISITSLSYMIPFSISSALSVKTGYSNGCKNLSDIKMYSLTGLFLILFYALITISIYLIFSQDILKIFTKDENLIQVGVSIIFLVASFTLFDGIQAVCMGILKGLKQTKQMLVIMILSYLFISIPIGIVLAYKFNLLLRGFWIGLSLGLFFASVASSILLYFHYNKLKRVYSN